MRRNGDVESYDDYDTYMRAGSAGELGKAAGMEQIGFWKKVTEHPAYDSCGASRRWTRCWPTAADGADDAGGQPVGSGGHLRSDGGVSAR